MDRAYVLQFWHHCTDISRRVGHETKEQETLLFLCNDFYSLSTHTQRPALVNNSVTLLCGTSKRKLKEQEDLLLSAYLTFMRLLSCVDQVMFLEVGQLRETFFAEVTLERSLTAVHSEMDLKPQQLSYDLCHQTAKDSHQIRNVQADGVTLRFDSCPNVFEQMLHSYLIFPFCFFSG